MLRTPLGDEGRQQVDAYIDRIGNGRAQMSVGDYEWFEFVPSDLGRKLGYDVCCWGGFSVENEVEIAIGCEVQFHDSFGFLPEQNVLLWINCNRPRDHEILGHMAVDVAEMFDGVVDFGGNLWPPLPAQFGRSFDKAMKRAKWVEDLEPAFQEMIHGMPGKIVGLTPERCDGYSWPSHYADATFIRAWLKHPRFYMIK